MYFQGRGILNLFCAGYHILESEDDEDHQEQTPKQDGYACSILYLLLFLTVGIVLAIHSIFSELSDEKQILPENMIIYITLITLVSTLMLSMYFCQYHEVYGEPHRLQHYANLCSTALIGCFYDKNAASKMFKQVFTYLLPITVCSIFYIGIIVSQVLELIKTKNTLRSVHIIFVSLYATEILLFCFVYGEFSGRIFKQTVVNRFTLATLIGLTFCLTLDAQVREAKEAYAGSEKVYQCNKTEDISTDHTSTISRIEKIIYPVQIEFCLMISEMLLHIFFSMTARKPGK